MDKIFKIVASLYIFLSIFTACTPDDYSLGEVDVKPGDLVEGIAFKIEHDKQNPNIIYLTSMMGSRYTPLWIHPNGRSQKETVTLKMPFAGTYNVQFGVMTRGGAVYGEPVTFKIDDMYAGFIEDEMWTLLAGGAEKSKTWYLDLNAASECRYFTGPLFFYGSDDWYGNVSGGGSPLNLKLNPDKVAAGELDSWNWNADYKGNSWVMAAGDYGSMTFDLKDGANVVVEHKMIASRGTEHGSYLIDTDNKTLTFTDATILHDEGRDGVIIDDWKNVRILSLTQNSMQLGVLRDPVRSGEGICLLVYNYISKEYYDNWTPGEVAEPEPSLPGGWKDGVSQTVSKSIKWVLSPQTPFNWAALDGSFLNDWPTLESYADWTGFDASVPQTYSKFSLTLNSADNSAVYVAPDGTEASGSYTLDEKGIYTFDGFKPAFTICSWVGLSTTDENQWRITKIEKDLSGNVSGMWVGKRDPGKPEYMVYHLIPQVGGGGSSEPQGKIIPFDNAKLVTGDIESKGNFRLELYNEFGSTKQDPPLDPTSIVFANKMFVTFKLEGIALKAGAQGTYKAAISFANPDWSVQYWGGGDGDVTVNGNGTYTLFFEPGAAVTNGALVYVIDIAGIFKDIEDPLAVRATIDKIELF